MVETRGLGVVGGRMSQGHVFFTCALYSHHSCLCFLDVMDFHLTEKTLDYISSLFCVSFQKDVQEYVPEKGPLKVLRLSVSDTPQMLMQV